MLDKNLACLLDDSEDESQDQEDKENNKKKETKNLKNKTAVEHIDKFKTSNEKNTQNKYFSKSVSPSVFQWNQDQKQKNLTSFLKNGSTPSGNVDESNIDFVLTVGDREKEKVKNSRTYYSHAPATEDRSELFFLSPEKKNLEPKKSLHRFDTSARETQKEIDSGTNISKGRNRSTKNINEKWKNSSDEEIKHRCEKPVDKENENYSCNFSIKDNKRKWKNVENNNIESSDGYQNNLKILSVDKQPSKDTISYEINNTYAKLRKLQSIAKNDDTTSMTHSSVFKENDFSHNINRKKKDIHENGNRDTERTDNMDSKSSSLFYENLALQKTATNEIANTRTTDKNNHFNNMEKFENKKNSKENKPKQYEHDNYCLNDSLLKTRNVNPLDNKLPSVSQGSTLELSVLQEEKQKKTFKNNTNILHPYKNINAKQSNTNRSNCNVENNKDDHIYKNRDSSNISTDLVGPAGIRQKLKKYNTTERETNKELIFYFSFIKYKSWIRALHILNFPLDNFHLNINSYKYLLKKSADIISDNCSNFSDTVDSDVSTNIDRQKSHGELFLYRNNIHNILNNNKIGNYQLDRMIVLVKSVLSRSNGYFLVVMDPSGHIPATVHQDIEKEYKRNIDVGSTLFLKNVTIFQTIDNFPYLIITLRSLVRVLKAEQTENELKEQIFSQLQL